jgi:hypothetical protein
MATLAICYAFGLMPAVSCRGGMALSWKKQAWLFP